MGADQPAEHRRQARAAGRLYLLLALTAPIGLLYVPGRIVVRGDAAATAEHLRASAWLVRLGIGSELFHQVVAVFLVLALYRLFKEVDERLAKELVILGALVSVPIVFVNVLNDLAAVYLAGGAEYLAGFTRPQLDGLAYLSLRLHDDGITVASVFWGLWLFPFGRLVIRSGFIPRPFGVLLFVAGTGYLAAAFTGLIAPRFDGVVSQIAMPLELGELPIVVWLVIWGARTRPANASPDRIAPR